MAPSGVSSVYRCGDVSGAEQTQGPAKTRGRSHRSSGYHSALSDGDHRSWHCPRHTDPDGDAISRNPTTGVSACLHVSGRGRGICQYQRGTGEWGGSEVSSLFGFWSMSNNVKDSTDRHWNMNFFFSGKLTDKDGKKDNLDALTSFPLAWNFHLPIGQGGPRAQEGDPVRGDM